ncbi:uncharacterized protein GGS25DRAFT_500212 [Hypoxylon fragiforme]|uniref:uncharacterized protein n=1 Tax=Hypoxylon fragiforme TaxID=63214 RepID=UPI0020C5E8DE|nr:uncharacterized protein GGS25DRAFT_500212 [Hypoxylon fragiforme]KAI2606237.1 hypothetical protein GGS25DRAFT_500212 [Hypoxylon fragiforme]
MLSFNSSCLRGKHSVLLKPRVSPSILTNVASRASSLSAIHRGLRDSEKSRPQGFTRDALNTAGSPRSPFYNKDARSSFKIKKGKKDITSDGPGPKSRKARFYDPDESFGKKSLVYQLNGGVSRGGASRGTSHRDTDRRRPEDRMTPDQFLNDFKSSSARSFSSDTSPQKTRAPAPRPRFGDRPSGTYDRPPRDKPSYDRTSGDRPSYNKPSYERSTGDRPSYSKPSYDRSTGDRPSYDRSSGDRPSYNKPSYDRSTGDRPSYTKPSYDRQTGDRTGQREERSSFSQSPPREHMPIRIPRTTAASQFLYGRFVVEAALKNSGRKLYKLYIYCGENRQDVIRDINLEKQAEQAGVPVVKVEDNYGLRMMDKMSEDRAHNGYVLEASPLPQLPLKALGPWTDDPTPGFHLELAHQSAEEEEVNGSSEFVPCKLPPNRKPFLLLLDKIQDPGNLGAILRSASFLGVNAVAMTTHQSAKMTSTTLKASAGASEILKCFAVSSVVDFLTRSQEAGWTVYAAVAPTFRPRGNKHLTLDRVDIYDPTANHPTILVVGSEGEGLDGKTKQTADFEVSIPNLSGSTVVDSLNVSVATGILCSAFLKKQFTSTALDQILESPEEKDDEERLF